MAIAFRSERKVQTIAARIASRARVQRALPEDTGRKSKLRVGASSQNKKPRRGVALFDQGERSSLLDLEYSLHDTEVPRERA